ncbi:MAG: 2-hydroxyacid dehydrogenase [Roseiarcus sp.]
MAILLAITGWDAQPWFERLRAMLPDREIVTPEAIGARAEVEYALSWRHPPGSLAGLPNLKAIFSLGAGVDHMFGDPRLPDVPIVRVVDAELRDRMSEWVALHALIHLRQQRMYDWRQDQRIWEEDVEQPAAADVRVGVMGLGVIGADAASKLAMIGFDVAGWSRTPRSLEGVACFHGADGLDAMLARTDILVALLPLTPATRGILSAPLFSKLARDGRLGGPILLNAGRGGLQVEVDILAALDGGVLKAATLDVFEVEPLPEESPLWLHPRVTISPHNAAISTPDAVLRNVVAQIEALGRGEGLKNVVDRRRGY